MQRKMSRNTETWYSNHVFCVSTCVHMYPHLTYPQAYAASSPTYTVYDSWICYCCKHPTCNITLERT
jgi:hypothetical protein